MREGIDDGAVHERQALEDPTATHHSLRADHALHDHHSLDFALQGLRRVLRIGPGHLLRRRHRVIELDGATSDLASDLAAYDPTYHPADDASLNAPFDTFVLLGPFRHLGRLLPDLGAFPRLDDCGRNSHRLTIEGQSCSLRAALAHEARRERDRPDLAVRRAETRDRGTKSSSFATPPGEFGTQQQELNMQRKYTVLRLVLLASISLAGSAMAQQQPPTDQTTPNQATPDQAAPVAAPPSATTSPDATPGPDTGRKSAQEEIVVTGSRVRRKDLTTPAPVTVISREQIATSSQPTIGSFLQQLPEQGGALNTNVNNGGDGSTQINLRDLGSQRTLVLVDGKRMVASGVGSGSAPVVDLNSIPTAAVERVEILKDGG